MKILFAASEAFPFIKTGGLGDVAYALPKALRKMGIDIRVILPKYSEVAEKYASNMKRVAEFNIKLGWRNQYCGLMEAEYEGIPFYFIDNEYYFKRAKAYGDYDDGERFSFFSKGILEAINYMGDFIPDILHCNDWHTAIAIPLLKDKYKNSFKHKDIKTMLTIHNLKFQGVFGKEVLSELLNLGMEYFAEDKLKFYDAINFLKGGIIYSDAITTVSNTYAEEIKTEYYGEGLHGLLRGRSNNLFGIVNGVDTEINNPKIDREIFTNYDLSTINKKSENKEQLQKLLKLPISKDTPMIAMVTRLEEQKGLELIHEAIEELLKEDIQFVVLGTGSQRYEDMFKFFAWKYPRKMSTNIFFDNSLAQKLYAGSDIFLMPSRFEPCGISQLIALSYGSIPIVRETGGLNDTVTAYNEFIHEGNGFSFSRFNAQDMLYTIRRAINFYKDKEIWSELITNAMGQDYSWSKSAKEYVGIYKNLLR